MQPFRAQVLDQSPPSLCRRIKRSHADIRDPPRSDCFLTANKSNGVVQGGCILTESPALP